MVVRTLREALPDIGARHGWIVDQAAGSEPLGREVASIALPNQLLGTPSATGVMWYAVASY